MMKGFMYHAGALAYDQFTGRWSLAFAPTLLSAAGVTVGQTVLEVAARYGRVDRDGGLSGQYYWSSDRH